MRNNKLFQRVRKTVIDFINPLSDLKFIWSVGLRPGFVRLRRLLQGEQENAGNAGTASLSFSQALAQSGQTEDALISHYRNRRAFWWWLMVLAGTLSVLRMGALLVLGHGQPAVIIIQSFVMVIVFAAAASVGGVKTAEATWRLWQLAVRRVSVQERGTFMDFWTEGGGYRSVIVPVWKGRKQS